MTTQIGLIGAYGKMGQTLISCITKDTELSLCWKLGSQTPRNFLSPADIIIDFSSARALLDNLALAQKMHTPLVLGTTGLQEDEELALSNAALELPIFCSSNFSLGMAIFVHAIKILSPLLQRKFTPSIFETHHVHKKDAPSGSALSLAEATQTGYTKKPSMKSFREGDVIGEHSISFLAEDETFTMQHKSISRDVFALGALQAAKFLVNKPPKLYQMQDLL